MEVLLVAAPVVGLYAGVAALRKGRQVAGTLGVLATVVALVAVLAAIASSSGYGYYSSPGGLGSGMLIVAAAPFVVVFTLCAIIGACRPALPRPPPPPTADLKDWLRNYPPVAYGVGFGIIVGAVVSAITQNPVWIGLGIPIGAAVGAAFQANRK